MNFKFKHIIIIVLWLNTTALKSKSDLPIHQILSLYQSKTSVTMSIKKTFTQPLLKKQTESSGRFYLSNNLWRLDLTEPKKSSIVYDGENITYSSNSNTHVIPPSQSGILHLLFHPKAFYKTFKYLGKSRKGRTQIYSFQGLTPSSPEKIFIQVEKDRILSLRVQWRPPLGEEYYRFSSIHFNQKLNKSLFHPPPSPKKNKKKSP